MLETAEKFGRPPSHWLGGLDGEWGQKDHLLTLALGVYRDGLCRCGKPISIAHHPDNDGWYETSATTCHACAAVERAQKDAEKKPGRSLFPVYERPSDLPIGTVTTRKRDADTVRPADDTVDGGTEQD